MTIKVQAQKATKGTGSHIIKVARRLFSEYGYRGVAMSDIAQKLNISKPALYYHYSGKTEIYKKVLNEVFNKIYCDIDKALKEKTCEQRMYRLVKSYLSFGFKEQNYIKALTLKLYPPDRQLKDYIIRSREQIARSIQPLVAEMIENQKIAPRVDTRLMTTLLTGMMDGLIMNQSLYNKKIDLDKITKDITRILFSNNYLDSSILDS